MHACNLVLISVEPLSNGHIGLYSHLETKSEADSLSIVDRASGTDRIKVMQKKSKKWLLSSLSSGYIGLGPKVSRRCSEVPLKLIPNTCMHERDTPYNSILGVSV